ncbi:VanZ like family protein [Novipirellula galeiformis]|uniref:VanZ like family protein n=1 Tax=Novipirellula galeiformis TaxID=2528004 RepID=A0A5C6CH90_9BACT|nr:VanZ family protein [Novipirellula galeiformis]TWU24030.1 VanZ like family protein [Novipirellula galeiformis]
MSSAPAYPISGRSMQSITKKTILGIRLAVLALVGYWLLIFVLTHLPAESLKPPKVNDKLAHFLAYGGLGMLMCYVTTSDRVIKRFGSIAAIGMTYAALDEYTQSFVEGRYSDPYDFLADAAGLCTAILVYATLRGVFSLWKKSRTALT